MFDDLPDGVGIASDRPGRESGGDVFHAGDGIGMGALAVNGFELIVLSPIVNTI